MLADLSCQPSRVCPEPTITGLPLPTDPGRFWGRFWGEVLGRCWERFWGRFWGEVLAEVLEEILGWFWGDGHGDTDRRKESIGSELRAGWSENNNCDASDAKFNRTRTAHLIRIVELAQVSKGVIVALEVLELLPN